VKGWQWLFYFEDTAIPGRYRHLFLLPEKPASVSWLDAAEKRALISAWRLNTPKIAPSPK